MLLEKRKNLYLEELWDSSQLFTFSFSICSFSWVSSNSFWYWAQETTVRLANTLEVDEGQRQTQLLSSM